jgi:hypothetical protein
MGGNLLALAKVSAVPFVIVMLISDLSALLDPLVYRFVWQFAIELPWTLMAVSWLRHLLLQTPTREVRIFPRPRRRHLRVLGYAVLLSCLYLPLTLFVPVADSLALDGLQREAFYWILYLPLLYLSLRFGFVFVAAAVDEGYGLALAWRHSRAIAFNLFLAVGLTAMLPWALFNTLYDFVAPLDPLLFVAAGLSWHVALWLVEGIYLAFLVVAFRRVTGWVPAPDPAILQRFE